MNLSLPKRLNANERYLQLPADLGAIALREVIKSKDPLTMFHAFARFSHKIFPIAAFCAVLAALLILPASAQEPEGGAAASPDPVAVFNEAQDLHEKGDLTGAITLYDKALQIEPKFPEAAYQRGIAQLSLGRDADAEQSFRTAIEIKPDWTLAATNLGALLVQKGETSEAERLLIKVIGAEPQNSAALVALTDLRLRTGAPTQVLSELLVKLTAMTSKANPTASLWSARSALETKLGKPEDARSSLSRALAIDPKYKPALYQAADIALADGDVERAKDVVRTLDSISDRSEASVILKANVLVYEGNTDDAVKLLDSLPASSAAAAEAKKRISTRGTVSVPELEEQLASDDKNPAILGKLCSALRRDDPLKALEYCRRAADADPANINHAIGFAAALVQARQYPDAVNILRKVTQSAPANWTAHANLATALFLSKRYAEAKPEYLWLTAQQPNLPAGFYFLAITFDELGEYADAVANYQMYLKIADPVQNKLDIERVNLRLPAVQKLMSEGKGRKRNGN